MSPRAVLPLGGMLLIALAITWSCVSSGGGTSPPTPVARPELALPTPRSPIPTATATAAEAGGVVIGSDQHTAIVAAATRWAVQFGTYDYRSHDRYQRALSELSTGRLRARLESGPLGRTPVEEPTSVATVRAVQVRAASAAAATARVELVQQRSWTELGIPQRAQVFLGLDLALVLSDAGWLASDVLVEGVVWP